VRGVSLAILMVLAVAAVLAFSVRSLRKERARLLTEFAAVQEATVRELTADLEDRLRDIEEDARVIATLVTQARAPSGATAQQRETDREATMLASFKAMATVVRHYRSLALFGPGPSLQVSAVDPAEDKETAAGLMRISTQLAARRPGPEQMFGPFDVAGGRQFFLYRFAIGADVVVITIEGTRFLLSALRSVPNGRIIVTDRGGVQWAGCSSATACGVRPAADRAADEAAWTAPAGAAWLDGAGARQFGLRDDTAVAVWSSIGSPGLGQWRVLLVVSAGALHAREKTLVRQLLLTAMGLVVAIGLVGALIVRQQRYAAALNERLRNAETLQSMERQLIRAEKLATTGVLAAGIAHEVGTPLGIIRARAELLMDQLSDSDGQRALDAIVRQIDRISSTIRQVLDFSRSQPVELQRLDVTQAVRSTLDLLEHRFRQQRLKVELEVDPSLSAVAADPNQFQQVMINVLMNACDACGQGGAIQIGARRSDDGERVRLDVHDTGEGIPSENLLAVFDPFFTTKKRGEGTGLGLPVAASIVRNHGGEISLASTPGEGTTVTIFWPTQRGRHDVQG
jgi:signal transduction histidine kinase